MTNKWSPDTPALTVPVTDDTTIGLIRRAIAQTYVTIGESRGPASDMLQAFDIDQMVMAVIQSLPKEVIIARSSCGGETVAASFCAADINDMIKAVNEFAEVSDPSWPTVERVPLILHPLLPDLRDDVGEAADAMLEARKVKP